MKEPIDTITSKAAAGTSFNSTNSLGQILLLIIVFAVVLFIAYYFTRFVAKAKIRSMTGRNVSIIETVNLGLGLNLHLIKAGEKYFLISATKEKIQLISEISSDNIHKAEIKTNTSFDKIMKECMEKFMHGKK